MNFYASDADLWFACPRSLKAADDAEFSLTSEGTSAHRLANFKIKKRFGLQCVDPHNDLQWLNDEMEIYTDDYVDYIDGIFHQSKYTKLLSETPLDLSKYGITNTCVCDCAVVTSGKINVIDFKYGKAERFSATNNKQLMIYALGIVTKYDAIYNIEDIYLTIYQPRMKNISNWYISKSELFCWSNTKLKSAVNHALAGDTGFCPTEHCRSCPIKSICAERAKPFIEIINYGMPNPYLLSDEQFERIVSIAPALIKWLEDVKNYALSETLAGKRWKTLQLEYNPSRRAYSDEESVCKALLAHNINPLELKLMPLTTLEKIYGKKTIQNIIGQFITKKQGSPKLTPKPDTNL